MEKLSTQVSEMGLEEAELTALGRGVDDEMGSYFLLMVKPTAESRDVDVKVKIPSYNSLEKEENSDAKLSEKGTQKHKRSSIEYGD